MVEAERRPTERARCRGSREKADEEGKVSWKQREDRRRGQGVVVAGRRPTKRARCRGSREKTDGEGKVSW